MIKDKKLEGISDFYDETDKEGIRVVAEVKKDFSPQVAINTLYKHTQLQIGYSMIMLALVDRVPKVLNLKEILECYVKHQKDVVLRRTQFDLNKALERLHLVEGFIKAQGVIDELIAIIRSSYERTETIQKMIAAFDFSEKQANAIYDMRLGRLNGLEVEKLQAEFSDLTAFVAECRDIIANPARLGTIVKDELLEIKAKYSNPRRSTVSYDLDSLIDIEDLIEREDVVISMTHSGYVKRQAVSEYRSQRRGGVGINAHKTKEEDFLESVLTVCTHDYLLFFTNRGRVYRVKAYEIPEAARGTKGRAIVNVLPLAADEKVNAILPLKVRAKTIEAVEDEALEQGEVTSSSNSSSTSDEVIISSGFLMLATKLGLIKKTSLDEYDRINKNGKIAISLEDGDELIAALETTGADEILLASSGGKVIRFEEIKVRPTGRTSQGVRSIKLDGGEEVVDCTVVCEGCELFTITENGYGKRTDIEEYRLQGRAGKGIKGGTITEKTGKIVCVKLITPDSDIMLISDSGIIIRVHADEISKIGRNTQGVRVMRVQGESKVVAVAIAPREEDRPEDESGE